MEGNFQTSSAQNPSNTHSSCNKGLWKEQQIFKHIPNLFTDKDNQLGVMDFLTYVEYFVSIGVDFGPMELGKRINVVSCFTSKSAFEWFHSDWAKE
jgi:hypothetical protein